MLCAVQSYTELRCAITCEHLAATGAVTRRTTQRTGVLSLGRNEFGEVTLRVEAGGAPLTLPLRFPISIHRRFAAEGKATLVFPLPAPLQLMISNCPSDTLANFLRTLAIKLEASGVPIYSGTNSQAVGGASAQGAGLKPQGVCQIGLTDRQRMRSELPRTFTDISPLSERDVETIRDRRVRAAGGAEGSAKDEKQGRRAAGGGVSTTPCGKRKLDDYVEKENTLSNENTARRKLCDSATSSDAKRPALAIGQPRLSIIPQALPTEQQRVLAAVQSGRSLFFTGSAGTGKSFLLKRIIGALPPQHTFVTASTGVAACHIGGTTLHAFAGMGSGSELSRCLELASRPASVAQWRQCKHLIIDEVSMVDGELFDRLEAVARHVRKSDKPFGGIQLIVCGDFLQLPPVTKPGAKRVYAFQSAAYRRCIGDSYLELKTVHRQSDQQFVKLLQDARLGRCTTEMEERFRATAHRSINRDGILATRLCTHKDDVDDINRRQLDELTKETSRIFDAIDSVPSQAALMNSLCPVASRIELKVGAQVMLTKNLDVQKGLVNGARGIVTGYEPGIQGWPIVKFMCGGGEQQPVHPEKWSMKGAGGALLQRKQIPLKLAWAISIHKSQGMTLDCVEISLARVFESGQAYVALSRAKSLDGLRVFDFNRRCIHADPVVLAFYRRMGSAVVEQRISDVTNRVDFRPRT